MTASTRTSPRPPSSRASPSATTGGAAWRTSSYSGNTGGECVEVATGCAASVPVRDSKDPSGPVLVIGAGAWRGFVAGLCAK
ncbi:DUF397 domain-containing protein [Streptomyces sp. NBC_01022]|uniref:DUF397 domain-containing protein n=1 Tax=Streptomyces sp. NBC_01022 TaxID=2903723 RepID=UPI002DDA037F|nr:DUF397 domain-containing protein [Streptomyces sp. NBC_01022]WRZ81573.1 DUF397 domain-containing protein [Streptomyces sp. NBC_01022]